MGPCISRSANDGVASLHFDVPVTLSGQVPSSLTPTRPRSKLPLHSLGSRRNDLRVLVLGIYQVGVNNQRPVYTVHVEDGHVCMTGNDNIHVHLTRQCTELVNIPVWDALVSMDNTY